LEKKDSDRRGFFSKIARFGIVGGITALLLGRLGEKTLMPPVQAAGNIVIDAVNTGTGQTVLKSSVSKDYYVAFCGNSTATTAITSGVAGWSSSTSGTGVYGYAPAISGYTIGVGGESMSTSGKGVFGRASATSGENYGVWGQSDSTEGYGVRGYAKASAGFTEGVCGKSDSFSGTGVHGYATSTTGPAWGVWGRSDSASGVSIMGQAGNAGATPIVAQGTIGQTANLQEWQNSAGAALNVINKDGWLGIGTSSPARSIHLMGSNACFRMDRNVNSSAFILVRTSPDFSSVWKTFYVGVDASGVNNGEFFIGDVGTNVSGASTKRLWIDNSGGVHIPNLITGDIALANDFTVTEDQKHGIAFKNDAGEKIAVLDREGNLHIKGKVIEDL